MRSHQKGETSATLAPTLWVILLSFAVGGLLASAAAPGWWATRDATNASLGTNDYAVALQGQLKQFTARAVDELNADLPSNGGAGAGLSNLVYGWQQDYLTNGYATNTANPTRPYKPTDLQAVTVGQLKYIASLVDAQLASNGYTGFTPSWLQVNPSTDSTIALVGQIKEVFDFDLSVAPSPVTNLTVSNDTSGELDLAWSLPTPNNGNAITIKQSLDGGTTYTLVATIDPSSTFYAVTDLPVGTNGALFEVTLSNPQGGTPVTSPPAPPLKASPRYAVIDLGAYFYPVAVNTNGVVAGNIAPSGTTTPQAAAVWNQGTITTLPSSPYGSGFANTLSDSGTVAGSAFLDSAPNPPDYPNYYPNPYSEYACAWNLSAGAYQAPVNLDSGMANPTSQNPAHEDGSSFAYGIDLFGNFYGTIRCIAPLSNATQFSLTTTPVYNCPIPSPPFDVVPNSQATCANGVHWGGYFTSNTGSSDPTYYQQFGAIIDGVTLPFDFEQTDIALLGINSAGTGVGIQNVNPALIAPGLSSNITPIDASGIPTGINTNLLLNPGHTSIDNPQVIGLDTSHNATLWDKTQLNGRPSTGSTYSGYIPKNLDLLIPATNGWAMKQPTGNYNYPVTAINDTGSIVGVGIHTPPSGGPPDPYQSGVMLLPVSLINLADPYRGTPAIHNPGHNSQDTPIIFKAGPTDANLMSVAWIASQDTDPANLNNPRMPKLRASIPAPTGTLVWWKLQVIFHDRHGNPHRDFDTGDPYNTNPSPTAIPDDTVTVPLPTRSGAVDGWLPIPAGTPWNIYDDPDWGAAVTYGFFGGDAVLSVKITTVDGTTTIMPETDWMFRIAGENPSFSVCHSFIASKYGTQTIPTRDPANPNAWQGFWFASAIAKEETVGIGSHHYYNQFSDNGGQTVAPKRGSEGTPAWQDDGVPNPRTGTGGYGIYQLTYQPGDANYPSMPRQYIWNWQANVIAVNQQWQVNLTQANNLYSGLTGQYPGTIPNRLKFSGLEAIMITYYNGMSGGTIKPIIIDGVSTPTCWFTDGDGAWTFLWNSFVDKSDGTKGYVDQVNKYAP